jgi:transposase-like protein
MKRKKMPLDRMEVTDAPAKAKVAMVLEVLSGEKPISKACQETGLKPLQYYKLEEKMVRAMLSAALLPSGSGRGRAPGIGTAAMAEETESLRQEHRRMKSLVRVSRKLLGLGAGKSRKYGPRKAKTSESAQTPPAAPEAPRRPGRPPLALAAAPTEARKEG